MGARMDKTNPQVGVVRAPLNADVTSGSWNKVLGVGLNSSGRVVIGVGVAALGIVGVAIFDKTNSKAGMPVDIFKLGEIILSGADLLTAATAYTANTTTGVVSNAAASATQIAVGFTVQNDRLILKGLG
jgi:hypothetical protein